MAFTQVKLTHRIRGTIYDDVLCPTCFGDLPQDQRTSYRTDSMGYALTVHPWGGAERCTNCESEQDAALVRADYAAAQGKTALGNGGRP